MLQQLLGDRLVLGRDQDVVLRNVPAKKEKIALRFRRPGVTARELSAEEKQFIKLWL